MRNLQAMKALIVAYFALPRSSHGRAATFEDIFEVGAHLALEFSKRVVGIRPKHISSRSTDLSRTTLIDANHGGSDIRILVVFNDLSADTSQHRDRAVGCPEVYPEVNCSTLHA
jgi:hypothetical protein